MQLCALDSKNVLIFADKAQKQTDYVCLECEQKVRLRSGMHRQAHFFHITPNRLCRLNGKGIEHIMVQRHLIELLPEGEAEMECRFSDIGRIGDVAWHSAKLIFEIQCSPITAREIALRNANYASIGYQVVWIFHDSRYNKHRISAAEDSILKSPHYFTDINDQGEGEIYDQASIIAQGLRKCRLPRLSVNLSQPMNLQTKQFPIRVPPFISNRIHHWQIGFSGDILDCVDDARIQSEIFQLMENIRERFSWKLFFLKWIVHPYKAVMKLFLERACR